MSSRADRRRRTRTKINEIKLAISEKVLEYSKEKRCIDGIIAKTNKWCREQANAKPQEKDLWRKAGREWCAEFDGLIKKDAKNRDLVAPKKNPATYKNSGA